MQRLGILLLFATAAVCAAEDVQLTFSPADGTVWTSRFESERKVTLGETPRTDSSLSEARHVVKKTDSGYEVATSMTAQSMKSNGHEIANPMMRAAEGVELTYVIDENGKATDIRGYDKILEAMKTKLPGPFFQQMAPLFNAPGLRTRDMRTWDQRVGELAGKTLTIGDAWAERKLMSLPSGGGAPYYQVTVVEGWTPCGEDKCLKLASTLSSDKEALMDAAGEKGKAALEAIDEEAADQPQATAEAEIEGSGERVFDPTTMRIHKQTTTTKTVGKAGFPGRGEQEFEVVDSRTYTVTSSE